MTELGDVVARVALSLSDAHVTALASRYSGAGEYEIGSALKAKQTVPAPHQSDVDRLNYAWAQQPDIPGRAIALALESASAGRRHANLPRVEVVVTGPNSPSAPVRLTSEVVSQLIDRASQRVTMVSYATYQLPSVIAALDRAAARGVQVSLILESPEKLEGGGGAHAYAKFRTYHWPIERRQPSDAKLHAKAVIVDGRDVLLTSANMTSAAYDKNIELGMLCQGGDVAHNVQRHFDGLIAAGVLERLA